MTNTIKAVVFDWGGVIASDPGDDFLRKLLVDRGVQEPAVNEIMAKFMPQFMRGQLTSSEYWREVSAFTNIRFPQEIDDEFKKWSGLKTEKLIIELVEKLKLRNYVCGLLTNVISPTYELLKSHGLYDMFDSVVASCEIGMAKPDPEIYEYLLDQLPFLPEEILFIDDKQRNLDAAGSYSICTLLAQSPQQIVNDTKHILGLI
jgi:putative hydrolase of the HAD superfamily